MSDSRRGSRPYSGINSRGNEYTHWGPSDLDNGGEFEYRNQDRSFYCQNKDGSTYFENGKGYAKYTPASENPRNFRQASTRD
ncbi:hypothetical protein CBR_g30736 [Chara braunii]|uniref:Uncharacterized protein n=1 Tax=Chara braunii TaxID=69332 RepID=A0A388LDI8_CHABU|nr:hypothetical protein CBR_g30736 [Chara braunii]|eukprot:GBG80368.1 hypothetical protein CBR_g30736 [Chara braunii]